MFYKALCPGNIGFNKNFMESAEPASRAGFVGYAFDTGDFAEDAAKVRETLQKYSLKPAGFGLPVDFRKDDATFRDGMANLAKHTAYAASIGVNRCYTYILSGSDDHEFAENYRIHRERLTEVCRVMAEYGMLMGLEFVGTPSFRRVRKHEFIWNLDGMLELCADTGYDKCGILMDIWHWNMAGHTFEDFKKLGSADKISFVHINDGVKFIPFDEQTDTARRLPGETGVFDFSVFFAGLRMLGYDGPVVTEPFVPQLGSMTYENALKTVVAAMDSVWPCDV